MWPGAVCARSSISITRVLNTIGAGARPKKIEGEFE